ncbi:MAG: hypothetical protein II559_00940 [Muribaculaceae bacterium]|nr:hypothetical protein [Muribaculaceae bacterium]
MKVSFDQWMKNPAKWMKKSTEYHNDMGAIREKFHRWAQTSEEEKAH